LEITVNGELMKFSSELTVLELLRKLDMNPQSVVVELNRVILERNALDTVTLSTGDVVEIVQFVGGG